VLLANSPKWWGGLERRIPSPGRRRVWSRRQTELDGRCPLCGLLCPGLLGGAAAPPYRRREDISHATASVIRMAAFEHFLHEAKRQRRQQSPANDYAIPAEGHE